MVLLPNLSFMRLSLYSTNDPKHKNDEVLFNRERVLKEMKGRCEQQKFLLS